MGDEVALDAGRLFNELGNQLRQNAMVALIALIFLVGGNLIIDQMGKSSAFAGGFLELAVQLYIIRAALKKANLLPADSKPKLWTFWWMSVMSALAIMLGCVLLIVPGVYLAARWFVAGPIVIAEDRSATEALRESWQRTRSSVWHLVGATFVVFGGGLAVAILPSIIIPQSARGISFDATTYLVMFAAYICGWLMQVGAYAMITSTEGHLAEVFA
jgi:hypothetical protein